MTRQRVTIADVACVAEVSAGTVSNVLNGKAAVRPETRNRVEAAIRELHFRPDTLARSLTARSRMAEGREKDPATPLLITVGYTSVDYMARVNVLPHRDDRVTALAIDKLLGGPTVSYTHLRAHETV